MRFMKRMIALLLAALLACSAAGAENAQETLDFRALTGLDELSRKLDSGVTVRQIFYTDGYGFSTSEFRTTDAEEIRQLWTALNRITVKGRTEESITDWYPQIVFTLSDGTTAHVSFESHWLSLPTPWPQANYELENDSDFWNLTSALAARYMSAAHPKDTWLKKPLEGSYAVGIRERSEDQITFSLYTVDQYDLQEIENLMPGDTVIVNGEAFTVAALLICGSYDTDEDGEPDQSCDTIRDLESFQALLDHWERVVDCDYNDRPDSFVLTHYELITTDEDFGGYIGFVVSGDQCRALENDWSPCTYVGSVTVPLPLPENFVFEDYAGNEGGAEDFLNDVSEDWYTPYNTDAVFENGLLIRVRHSDYPMGPED